MSKTTITSVIFGNRMIANAFTPEEALSKLNRPNGKASLLRQIDLPDEQEIPSIWTAECTCIQHLSLPLAQSNSAAAGRKIAQDHMCALSAPRGPSANLYFDGEMAGKVHVGAGFPAVGASQPLLSFCHLRPRRQGGFGPPRASFG